jgi:hypothetical protein
MQQTIKYAWESGDVVLVCEPRGLLGIRRIPIATVLVVERYAFANIYWFCNHQYGALGSELEDAPSLARVLWQKESDDAKARSKI